MSLNVWVYRPVSYERSASGVAFDVGNDLFFPASQSNSKCGTYDGPQMVVEWL